MPFLKHKLVVLAAAAGLGLGGGAIATAQSTSTDRTTKPARAERAPLSSEDAAKVKAAALERVPGATVDRTEAGGPYGTPFHAHITTSDGTEQVVLVDAAFNATAVQADQRRGRGGRGGPGGRHGDTAALAQALGVTDAELRAALEATRPARGDRADKHAEEAAAIAEALGASQADVLAAIEAAHQDGGRRSPGRHEALAAALARELGVSQAKAQSAVDAAHDARHAAKAAALAKALGISQAKVEAALAQARPRR